ncbi:RNA polymerase II transcription elongation factor-domain-containing protein [Mycena rebaudengoi]|nr:RNA polymerase II transcription elongation factor-domain-containing protein [Mycena rebaudengoi]
MDFRGRQQVQIGPSLNKALKARKGGPPPQVKRTGPPEKDFYSFRYNFKPPSIDPTKPGTIDLSRSSKDSTSLTVEHPSSQPGESHVFVGNETSAKEFDCVLIYDEETGSYKLEKLESYIVLTYERKTTTSLPSAASPLNKSDSNDLDEQLSNEDAAGEIDDEMPSFPPPLRQEEEEEEEDADFEEVLPVAAPAPVRPPPPPPPAAKPARAPKNPPPVRGRPEVAAPARAAKASSPRKTKKPAAAAPVASDAEEEDLEFGRPATKRASARPPAPAPPPPVAPRAPEGLSFPGPSASYVPPPAPPTNGRPMLASTSTSASGPAARAPASPAALSDSDEDEWEAVVPNEIDINEFELTLEAEMEAEMADADADGDADADADADADDSDAEEEPDFLAAALPTDSSMGAGGRPLSLRQLAGGEVSEDEYSSSDDSDDD